MRVLTAGRLLRLGAGLAAVGVALGAFGAHGLKSLVTPERLAVFETGVRYHLVHALAVLAAAGAAYVAPQAAGATLGGRAVRARGAALLRQPLPAGVDRGHHVGSGDPDRRPVVPGRLDRAGVDAAAARLIAAWAAGCALRNRAGSRPSRR